MDEIDAIYLGHVAVFYIPVQKLDSVDHGKDGKTPRELFEQFLMTSFDAYTLETSAIEGYWRRHPEDPIFKDQNARYEVSFHGDVKPFVQFLSEMCSLLEEQAIYLTMGYKSWLVLPKGSDEIRD